MSVRHLALEATAEALLLLRAWWWPSDPPRMRIESRVDSDALHVDVAGGRVTGLVDGDRPRLLRQYSMLTAVPDSTVVIASTMSPHSKRSRP